MTVSVLKMHFRKLPPKIISYRDFSNYHKVNFINSLNEVLFEGEYTESFVKDPDCFYKVCTEVLNQHARHKKKYVRRNNKRFMKNALSKAIMQRTKLRNKFMKDPSAANKLSYNRQRNWCVSHYYENKRENILPIQTRKILQTIKNFGKLLNLIFQSKLNPEKKLL